MAPPSQTSHVVDPGQTTIVSVGPWPWSHFYNRSQPLAMAFARLGCRVIYVDPVEVRRRRLPRLLRLFSLVFPWDRARAHRKEQPHPNLSVVGLASRRGRTEPPWVKDYSPAARVALERYLRYATRGAARRHLIFSRHPKLSVTQMLPWDHVTFDIEDPWFEHPWGDHPFVRLSVRQALARADLVTANGFATEEMFHDLAARPITVMPNGVERTLLEALDRPSDAPEAFGLGRNRLRLLFTGRIDARIHFDLLAAVLPEFPDVDVYFVGEAHIRPEIKEPWERLMATGHCYHVPRVPYEDIPRFLAHADAFLLPYSAWGASRMFPGKLLEYIAAARPILAARSYREVEPVGDTIKAYRDADELRAIMRLERERSFTLTPEQVARCRTFVRDNTWEKRAETLFDLWAGV